MQYSPFLISITLAIAILASFVALNLAYTVSRSAGRKRVLWLTGGSVAMGAGIWSLHFIGILAMDRPGMPIVDQIPKITLVVVAAALALAISVGVKTRNRHDKFSSENLVKSEEKFRLLVEAVKDYAIFMLDLDGNITTWNSGAQRIIGYSEKEVLGKHVSLFYKTEDIDNCTAEKELVSARRFGHFEAEGERVRKDGSTYWASIVISPLFDAKQNVTGYSKVTRDITLLKEADQRLRILNEELEERVRTRTAALARRETQLRSITNALPVLIGEVDQNEVFTFANEGLEQWFDMKVVGKSFKDVLGNERYPENKPFIDRVLKGETVTYERNSMFGQMAGVLSITFVPDLDKKNQVAGFIVLASNVSKYKEIEQQLKRAKNSADVANETKSAFLANMSHEIRTPLGAVLGFSELLLNDDMSPSERHNSVEVIKRNGQLLSNIINDILDLSKVEAGKMEIEKIPVPFSEVMKEISSSLSLGAAEKGLKLIVDSKGPIPHLINTDPLRLRQILLNIVGNAIKFTRRGSVHVTFQIVTTANGARKLAFVVKDTGEGIHTEQLERLFIPFSQADVSTTRKFGGTGLGLILSKKLALALGGDIELTETAPGKGSTFTITIDPGSTEGNHDSKNQFHFSNVAQTHPKSTLDSLKILLVDDSLDNQLLIKRILKIAGAEVQTANNGREGYEQAMAGHFDVVLMDLQMPEMDGYEATKLLREQGYTKPVIALTAHAMKEERERSLKHGFDNHITKPIDQKFLISTLSTYVI